LRSTPALLVILDSFWGGEATPIASATDDA
jgi:hypothetical protein